MPAPALSPIAIALNRFSLGARPGEAPPADPRRWLTAQFADYRPATAAFTALPDAATVLDAYQDARREVRRTRDAQPAASMADHPTMPPDGHLRTGSSGGPAADGTQDMRVDGTTMMAPRSRGRLAGGATDTDPAAIARLEARRAVRRDVRGLLSAGIAARTEAALVTPAPFVERMVHFWANHFAVSADNARVSAWAPAFERDAIRPHVLGSFQDMLLAVEQHPAMLIYLNQVNSIGPDSPAGQRQSGRRRGLNENLAREIMELHTLGARSGYAQSDVIEFARAMTGWTTDGSYGAGAFAFRANRHQPGDRTIMGRRYPAGGETQARGVLADFALAPATATHIATKLARHVAGDDPPPALVSRLAADFTRTRGDLASLYAVLVASPEAWAPAPVKFKSPWEWALSCLRALGRTTALPAMSATMQQLGQPVWKPGSPAGWDDTAAAWAAPDALMRRVEVAARLTAPLGDRLDARTLGPQLLPASLSSATADQLARAESPSGALALLLASPDFLRR